MKILFALFVFLFPVMASAQLTTPPAPATELSYEELMKQGEQRLQPDAQKRIFAGDALALFNRAVKAAPDSTKKFNALVRVAQIQILLKQVPAATTTYNQALELRDVPAGLRARALFGSAHLEYEKLRGEKKLFAQNTANLRANINTALSSTELTPAERRRAMEILVETDAAAGNLLAAAQGYQKVLGLPDTTPQQRDAYLLNAVVLIQKSTAQPAALNLAKQLYPQYTATKKTADEIARAKLDWGQVLWLQQDKSGALAKWDEIARDTAMPIARRSDALQRINIAQRENRDLQAALAAADRLPSLSTVPTDAATLSVLRSRVRAVTFQVFGQEDKARSEWLAVTTNPAVSAQEKAKAHIDVARSWSKERKSNPRNAAAAAGEKMAFESAWNTTGATLETRADGLLGRAQFELDNKNNAAARTLLLDGVRASQAFQEKPEVLRAFRREMFLKVATINRAERNYSAAIAALIESQNNAAPGDKQLSGNALALFQEAYKANDLNGARSALTAMRDVWGASPKSYFFNLAQVEVAAQQWPQARKALDDFNAQSPTPAEKAEADKLRAKIPAG